MTLVDLTSLLMVTAAAVLAPLLAGLTRGLVPGVVVEILFGMLIGPAALGWVVPDSLLSALAAIGLALLMFLAGFEVDLAAVRGWPLALAGRAWLASLGLAGLVALVVAWTGHRDEALYLALPLCTTALGTLLPIVRDAGIMSSPLGRHVLATGSVGEFGPIVLIAVLLGAPGPLDELALVAAFSVMVLVGVLLARHRSTQWLRRAARRGLHSTSQLPVRLAMLLIVAFVFLAGELGLDVLLGSFAAGLIVRVATADLGESGDASILTGKFEAVGFGVLIPVFFVVSGMGIDVASLVRSPLTLVVIPITLGLLLLCRGGPVLVVYRGDLDHRSRVTLALFGSTSLPLIIVITALGVQAKALPGALAAAIVAAGLLSVLLFPVIGMRMGRGSAASRHTRRS